MPPSTGKAWTALAGSGLTAAATPSICPLADQFLLTIVWLRHYPTQECLGYLFGVSDSTALRAIRRCLPILERTGHDPLRLPDPGQGQRRDLPALLKHTPALAVIVDTFAQRTQRPQVVGWVERTRADPPQCCIPQYLSVGFRAYARPTLPDSPDRP